MKKIRIAYTIPNFDTAGSGIALLKLAAGLDRNLFEPMIVCLHDRGDFFKKVVESGIPVHIYPYLSPLKPRLPFLHGVIRIARFFRRLSPDIVFSYHYSADFSEAVAARLAGCRFMYVKKNMGWYGPSMNQWRIKTRLSNAITVQNTDMMNDFFKNSNKAHLVSIGVDQAEFYPRPPDLALRNELGLEDGGRVVLCVANLIEKKGIPVLIRAFSGSKHKANSVLVIVGRNETALWQGIKELVREEGMEGRVIFTGMRPDVCRFFTIADLFVLASTGDEGAPIAIQEAMASGIPVVTTDTPGNRDQLRDLPSQLVPPSDVGALREAIDRMLDMDEETRSEISSKQLQIVGDRFSLENEVARHQEIYMQLMRRTR